MNQEVIPLDLSVQQLSFSYPGSTVLSGISFCLHTGCYICVLGKNGAGKTTLFKCILGLLRGYRGDILLGGCNIRTIPRRELAASIAYIPQVHPHAFPYSVMDMVLMGTTSAFSAFSTPGKKQRETAEHALSMLGLESFARRTYTQLSGGEQQLVLIARALAQNARILIMDEPCASLDYGNQIRVMEKLDLLSKSGYLILQSTHNPEHAFLFADRVLVLKNGRTGAFGSPQEVLTQKLLEEIYQIPVSLVTVPETGTKTCIPGRLKKNNGGTL